MKNNSIMTCIMFAKSQGLECANEALSQYTQQEPEVSRFKVSQDDENCWWLEFYIDDIRYTVEIGVASTLFLPTGDIHLDTQREA